MSTYDPRRSRPTPKVVPDEESAPIDVLLGPGPDDEPAGPTDAPDIRAADDAATAPATAATTASAPTTAPAPAAAPVRRVERAPSAMLQLAPLLVVVLAVLVAWLVRRSRR